MTISVVLASMAALILASLLAYERLRARRAGRAIITPGGHQEATITIEGRYRPDTVRVKQGLPVRLHIVRKENNPCSERVVFSAFGVDRRLPAFQETIVEFVPTLTGTFLFTCEWGMYRGKLVVSGPRRGAQRPSELGQRAVTAEMENQHERPSGTQAVRDE